MTALPERKRRAYCWMAHAVGDFAAPGLGNWSEVWEYVEFASMEFSQAVEDWGGQKDREGGVRVKEAGEALIQAWREANDEYLKTGGGDGGTAVVLPRGGDTRKG